MNKVALVYDRVNKWGGAERVLLVLHEMFPKAPLYTSVYSEGSASWAKKFPEVYTSFLQKVPGAVSKHEHFAYLMPIVFESFDFTGYDLVISVTSEAAKGIITKPGTTHICYMLTPTRYLWSHHDFYFRNPQATFKKYPFFSQISKPIVSYLRAWDKVAAQRPDKIISQSTAVKKRVRKYYDRDSVIINPPVEVDKFKISITIPQLTPPSKPYYLSVSRLIPYKRADLVIDAFNDLGLPLIIVGIGSEEKKLKNMAADNIKFVGELTDNELAGYYQNTEALIFPQEEDFGLVVLEANAAGSPVIAYGAGGALDTVIPGKTGIFFDKQNKTALIKAVRQFQKMKFKKSVLVNNAERFSKEKFKSGLKKIINDVKN